MIFHKILVFDEVFRPVRRLKLPLAIVGEANVIRPLASPPEINNRLIAYGSQLFFRPDSHFFIFSGEANRSVVL